MMSSDICNPCNKALPEASHDFIAFDHRVCGNCFRVLDELNRFSQAGDKEAAELCTCAQNKLLVVDRGDEKVAAVTYAKENW